MENEMPVSILYYIADHIKEDGMLDSACHVYETYVRRKGSAVGMCLADGFLDGSFAAETPDIEPLCQIIEMVSDGNRQEAEVKLAEFFAEENATALSCIDDLLHWIRSNAARIDAEALANFSVNILPHSRDVESVKLSLALLELFDLSGDETVQKIISILALSDELTRFCVFAVSGWPHRNEWILSMAKRVFGWGRIAAIEWIEPETEEIRNWLLEHGCEDSFVGEYVALDVADKVDILSLLQRKDLTYHEHHSIGNIVMALLGKGPTDGIDGFKEKEELLRLYLLRAKSFTLELHDYEIVYAILKYVHEDLEGDVQYELKQLGGDLICTAQCQETVCEALRHGKGFALAEAMGIDVQSYAARCIETDPLENVGLLKFALGKDAEEDRRLIGLYTGSLLKEDVAADSMNGQGETSLLSGLFFKLAIILQELQDRPGLGEELVCGTLRSKSAMRRSRALLVAESWKGMGMPFSDVLRSALRDMKSIEDRPDELARLEAL